MNRFYALGTGTTNLEKTSKSFYSHCICVSHTGKENTVLRSGVPKSDIFVIPNAVDATMFEPDYERQRPPDKVVVVLGSRLVYRKGKMTSHSELLGKVLSGLFSGHHTES